MVLKSLSFSIRMTLDQGIETRYLFYKAVYKKVTVPNAFSATTLMVRCYNTCNWVVPVQTSLNLSFNGIYFYLEDSLLLNDFSKSSHGVIWT